MTKWDEMRQPDSCLNRARNDELIFVLRQDDRAATVAVGAWIEARLALGANLRTDPRIVEAEEWIRKVFEARL